MMKKAGIVTVGVSAALLAAAPLASAGEVNGENADNGKDKDSSKHDDWGKKNNKDKGKGGNTTCQSQSGDNEGNEGKGLVAGAGSILSSNSGQLASCNSFLNDNFSGNKLKVASPILAL